MSTNKETTCRHVLHIHCVTQHKACVLERSEGLAIGLAPTKVYCDLTRCSASACIYYRCREWQRERGASYFERLAALRVLCISCVLAVLGGQAISSALLLCAASSLRASLRFWAADAFRTPCCFGGPPAFERPCVSWRLRHLECLLLCAASSSDAVPAVFSCWRLSRFTVSIFIQALPKLEDPAAHSHSVK